MPVAKPKSAPLGFATLAGTPKEVRAWLGAPGVERVVALTFRQGDEKAAQAVAETLRNIVPLVGAIVQQRERAALESIVEALVPNVPPPEHMLIETRMMAQARKAVLDGAQWLTAAQIAELAGFSAANPSAQPNKWKKAGSIFAITHHGVDYFPGYGLDPGTNYRPRKVLKEVLDVFGDAKDGWGLAYWFGSVNSFLGGRKPQDLLMRTPARVVAAARDEMAGIAHG